MLPGGGGVQAETKAWGDEQGTGASLAAHTSPLGFRLIGKNHGYFSSEPCSGWFTTNYSQSLQEVPFCKPHLSSL